MCGITAMFSRQTTIEADRLLAATKKLSHRGPDGQSTWLSSNGVAGLGHARLDISTAETPQPIHNENGRIHIVVNGEFYDHEHIRHGLLERGHQFHTTSDSEIALHLYEELGEKCVDLLRGEYAFIIWDETRQTLFAARDRFGIKPLFYAWHHGQLWFASEAKALFAAGLPAEWDEMAVYERIFGCYQSKRSFFANVEQLPPAHTLSINIQSGTLRLKRYWDVGFPHKRQQAIHDEAELVEQIHDQLLEAVTLRMQAHVPVGCLLSGGLDSSTILAMACAHSEHPVTAFTISFDEAQHDESDKARRTADYLGANLHVIPAGDDQLADHFAEAAYSGEMIQYNGHGVARWILSRAIQEKGYRAVLAGEGADELFAGYAFMRSALSTGRKKHDRSALLSRLFRPTDSADTSLRQLSPKIAFATRLLPLPNELRHSFGHSLNLLQAVLDPAFSSRFQRYDPAWALLRTFDWRGQLWGRESAKQLSYIWLNTLFANYHLAADRLDMAHAVEVRLPFLDHHLFQNVGAIPIAQHAQQGYQKYLLRRVCERYLPHEIAFRPKKPFYAPTVTQRPNSRMRQLTADMLHSQTMATIPFFDQQFALTLFERSNTHQSEQTTLDPLLMMIVSMCYIQERFGLS